MKSSLFNIMVAVIVITVIILSMLCSCTKVRPYSPSTIFSREYPYEGFATLDYLNNNPKSNDLVVNQHKIDSPEAVECNKISGFNGLFCKPDIDDSKIDKFSDAKGDPKCFGQSCGLSNSKGSLCL